MQTTRNGDRVRVLRNPPTTAFPAGTVDARNGICAWEGALQQYISAVIFVNMTSYGGDLIREARRRAGLTQAALAEQAGTAQPAIARWESGRTAVSLDDVLRLVRLCGLDLEVALVPRDDSDLAQAARLAGLSGQQRLDRNIRLTRQLQTLREA